MFKPKSLHALPAGPTISSKFENIISTEYLGESFSSETKIQISEIPSNQQIKPMEISPKSQEMKSSLPEPIQKQIPSIQTGETFRVPEKFQYKVKLLKKLVFKFNLYIY